VTRLLRTLLEAGVPVIEAAPEGGRLERRFEPPGGPAPGAGGGGAS
jgi:hypothetical protein